jgi:hypothetical protein
MRSTMFFAPSWQDATHICGNSDVPHWKSPSTSGRQVQLCQRHIVSGSRCVSGHEQPHLACQSASIGDRGLKSGLVLLVHYLLG